MKKFDLMITKKEYIATHTILLEAKTSLPLYPKPGQFITFIFDAPDGKKAPRSYSLVFDKEGETETIQLCIRLFETGIASDIFRECKVGDSLSARGPVGVFVLNEESEKTAHVFVGTDTGIAPLYSMIQSLSKRRPNDTIHLFFGAKTKENLYFHEQFLALTKRSKSDDQCATIKYYPTVSREKHTDLANCYVQELFPKEDTFYTGSDWYICGNSSMVNCVTGLLSQKDLVLDKDIFLEKFD